MIEVRHLTKTYGSHTAVDNLSFTIEKGQIYGFLGPNGAGKSTTMNIMTGTLAATSGDVIIEGYDIFENPSQAKKYMGYLPEIPPLYPERTPREYLRFVAEAKGVSKKCIETEIERVMNVTDITAVGDRLCRNLSKGYRQRVGIAQALLGDPEIIILDEPTVGLDPKQIIEIRELIKSLGEGHTVILSSHILSEVQAVCTTILIISKGKLVACDTPENLEKLFEGKAKISITCECGRDEAENTLKDIEADSVEIKEDSDTCSVSLEVSPERERETLRKIFFAFAGAGYPVLRMETEKASLEDIFIELTGSDNARSADDQAEESGDSPENMVTGTQDEIPENKGEEEAEKFEGGI